MKILPARFGDAQAMPSSGAPASPKRGRVQELVVFLAPENRGWILERICREIVRHVAGSAAIVCEGPCPPARVVLYSHFALLERHPLPRGARSGVIFYHPWKHERDYDPSKYRVNETLYVEELRRMDRVISLSSGFLPYLAEIGLRPDRLCHVTVGSDRGFFPPHRRSGDGAVGFVSAYYPRKNPKAVLDLVHELPHREFLLVGRGWEKFDRFDALVRAPNLRYREVGFASYPEQYAQMDVLCSPSFLEGACVPVLEAMLSNVVPVASRTGHAPDLIRDGQNGFLFDPVHEADRIPELVERAFTLETDVSRDVSHLTWERFARRVLQELGVSQRAAESAPARSQR